MLESFFNAVAGLRPATALKGDSSTGVFLRKLFCKTSAKDCFWIFLEQVFSWHLQMPLDSLLIFDRVTLFYSLSQLVFQTWKERLLRNLFLCLIEAPPPPPPPQIIFSKFFRPGHSYSGHSFTSFQDIFLYRWKKKSY